MPVPSHFATHSRSPSMFFRVVTDFLTSVMVISSAFADSRVALALHPTSWPPTLVQVAPDPLSLPVIFAFLPEKLTKISRSHFSWSGSMYFPSHFDGGFCAPVSKPFAALAPSAAASPPKPGTVRIAGATATAPMIRKASRRWSPRSAVGTKAMRAPAPASAAAAIMAAAPKAGSVARLRRGFSFMPPAIATQGPAVGQGKGGPES
mmetsp:Transcript_45142/g.125205  ORF Transcript_45142/g.125205 Transcript_45142/m.125205 type:complete len:206 (+) Transcript_45142:122-739(+)